MATDSQFQSNLRAIVDRLDVSEFVLSYQPEKAKVIERDGVRERLRCCCPFPDHDDKNPSFHIWLNGPKKGRWACTPNCGSGDLFEFIKRIEGTDFKGALAILNKKAPAGVLDSGFDPTSFIKNINRQMAVTFAETINMPPMPHCERNAKMIAWYLQWRRHYSFEDAMKVIHEWGLLWCVDGMYNPSIIIPLHDADGKQVMWQAQFVDGRSGKNKLYPAGGWNPAVLPGMARCIREGYRWAVLVEGFWNLTKSWSRGVPAIATMSAWVNEQQIAAIYRHLDRVTTGFDNDDAGREAAERVEKSLANMIEVNHLSVPHKTLLGKKLDVDDMTADEYRYYLENAVSNTSELANPVKAAK
jgi:hypothetical protein